MRECSLDIIFFLRFEGEDEWKVYDEDGDETLGCVYIYVCVCVCRER